MKEALTAKGRHLRRSVSTPNVELVMLTSICVKSRISKCNRVIPLSRLHVAKQT